MIISYRQMEMEPQMAISEKERYEKLSPIVHQQIEQVNYVVQDFQIPLHHELLSCLQDRLQNVLFESRIKLLPPYQEELNYLIVLLFPQRMMKVIASMLDGFHKTIYSFLFSPLVYNGDKAFSFLFWRVNHRGFFQ